MKLSKAQSKTREELVAELATQHENLTDAVNSFNEKMQASYASDIAPQIEQYNEQLSKARDWVTECQSEIDEYTEGKTDKWTESEKGQAVQALRDSFDDVTLDDISLDAPEELSLEDIEEHYTSIEELSTETE